MSAPEFHLALASDANPDYLLGLTVAAGSALRHLSRGVRPVVHILDLEIPDEAFAACGAALRGIRPDAEVRRHRLRGADFAGMPTWRGSHAALARLLLPDLLPQTDEILYADCDVLFTDDPAPLLGRGKAGAWISGHENLHTRWVREEEYAWLRERGYAVDESHYVNSGLLAMNLRAFREHAVTERCLAFLRRHAEAPLGDQMALNVACAGHVGLLPERWGIFAIRIERPILLHRGAIHFAGVAPWVSLRDPRFPDAAASREWLRVAWALARHLPADWFARLPGERAFFWGKWLQRRLWWACPAWLVALPWKPRNRRAMQLWRRRAQPVPLDVMRFD